MRTRRGLLSAEDVAEIRASELSTAELARIYGVSYFVVRDARIGKTYRDLSEDTRERAPWEVVRWSDAQKARAVRAVRAGVAAEEVAKRFECTAETVRRWEKEMRA